MLNIERPIADQSSITFFYAPCILIIHSGPVARTVPIKNLVLCVKIGMLSIHVWRPCHTVQFSCNLQRYFTLGRCEIGKYTFPSQFANIFLTHQTFVTNLHLLRVELRCKLPGKLYRVTGPLAHDVVLNHTFELLINTTMLFWYIWNEHFNK